MKQTLVYRETESLGDVLSSRLEVTTNIKPSGLIEVIFSTVFTQAKNPKEPRVQHRIYVTPLELEHIIILLSEAAFGEVPQ